MTAELHCHSLFSVDGWATPEEIAQRAASAGIGVLALTDHNCVDGLASCADACSRVGVRFVPGVEFDCEWRGSEYHVVAFGVDFGEESLVRLCRRQFKQYEKNFSRFLPIIEARFNVGETELREGLRERYCGHRAPVLNKWFARSFLVSRGLLSVGADGARIMSEIAREAEAGVEQPWVWAQLEEIRDCVHRAGGILLLAHPAGYKRGDLRAQIALIEDSLAAGLDGFELFHPANMREAHFVELVALGQRLGCALSGGSDCHFEPDLGGTRCAYVDVPDWAIASVDAAILGRKRAILK